MTIETRFGQRPVLFIIALAFLAMLVTSLARRFENPSLTVSRYSVSNSGIAGETASAESGAMGIIGQLMRHVSENPNDREAILRLVENLMAIGQWQGAENFAQKALALDKPGSPDPRAMYLLALVHHNQGRHAQAAELLEKLLENSDNPSARYSLGLLYLHFLNEPQKGIEILRKGVESDNTPPALKAAMEEELQNFGGQPEAENKAPESSAPADAEAPQTTTQ